MKFTFLFFISFLTVLVTPAINMPQSSNNFMILIISFISSFDINELNTFSVQSFIPSFDINKWNPFSVLTVQIPDIFC